MKTNARFSRKMTFAAMTLAILVALVGPAAHASGPTIGTPLAAGANAPLPEKVVTHTGDEREVKALMRQKGLIVLFTRTVSW